MSDYNHIGALRRQSDSARKLLKKQGIVPRAIVTDRLKSYAAAKKQVMKQYGSVKAKSCCKNTKSRSFKLLSSSSV